MNLQVEATRMSGIPSRKAAMDLATPFGNAGILKETQILYRQTLNPNRRLKALHDPTETHINTA